METTHQIALVLGAANPLGAAIARAAAGAYDRIILADTSRKRGVLSALVPHLGIEKERIRLAEMDTALPFAGLSETWITAPEVRTVDIYHAAHRMDRSLPAAEIHSGNTLALERVFSLAFAAKEKVGAVTVITDVGLAGDFVGRFSESWTDVGQTPFDDVDKSSLDVERICAEETRLPLIRCRTGLTLLPPSLSDLFVHWRSADEVLLSSVRWLQKLPRFVTVPAAVAEGALAPVTPSDWAAEAMVHLARNRNGIHRAHHLIVDPKPSMETVLNAAARKLGGAKIKGGLPINLVAKLGKVPGLKEAARRNADQIASWWTPHRYCLSVNDLDTTHLNAALPAALAAPTWKDVEAQFR